MGFVYQSWILKFQEKNKTLTWTWHKLWKRMGTEKYLSLENLVLNNENVIYDLHITGIWGHI